MIRRTRNLNSSIVYAPITTACDVAAPCQNGILNIRSECKRDRTLVATAVGVICNRLDRSAKQCELAWGLNDRLAKRVEIVCYGHIIFGNSKLRENRQVATG